MTYYFVFPKQHAAQFTEVYLAQEIRDKTNPPPAASEKPAVFQIEGPTGQGRAIIGASRATAENVRAIEAAGISGLQVTTEWPGNWVRPKDGEPYRLD